MLDRDHLGAPFAAHEERVEWLQEAINAVRTGEGIEEAETGAATYF